VPIADPGARLSKRGTVGRAEPSFGAWTLVWALGTRTERRGLAIETWRTPLWIGSPGVGGEAKLCLYTTVVPTDLPWDARESPSRAPSCLRRRG